MNDRLLTAAEVAEFLALSTSTILDRFEARRPSRLPSLPQVKQPRSTDRASALDAVSAELPRTLRAVPMFAALTGLRPCEWMALERADVDRKAG
jgi:hypothetical protein